MNLFYPIFYFLISLIFHKIKLILDIYYFITIQIVDIGTVNFKFIIIYFFYIQSLH